MVASVACAPRFADAQDPADLSDYRVTVVDAALAEGAYVDWFERSDEGYARQERLIEAIFGEAAMAGAAERLSGEADARLTIRVVHFDILSNLEKFFCCALNEVDADYELTDAVTGAVLKPKERLNFDHFGRGGVMALLSAARGRDQISRVKEIILEKTRDWLSAPPT